MTAAQYHLRSAAALALGVLVCAASWLWTHYLQTTGAVMLGYWVGVVGSAVPAIVLITCILWLQRERSRGESAARVFWLWPLFVLSIILLAFMVLFPML